jgi:hypothetical protein
VDELSNQLFGQPRQFEWVDLEDVERLDRFLMQYSKINPRITDFQQLFDVLGIPNGSIITTLIGRDAVTVAAKLETMGIEILRNAIIEDDGNWVFYWHDMRISEVFQKQSIGSCVYLHALRAAMYYGFKMVTMQAMRIDEPNPERQMTGYCVFPKLGFDGILSENLEEYAELITILQDKGVLSEELEQIITVQDLLTLERGKEFWELHGYSLYMTFNLESHSSSWEIFEAYLSRRGIELARGWLS